ncbi:MAG: LysE family transporter [Candidatus Aminicenantes bacterium]
MFVLLGILVGLLAAVPVGPINLYVASQTLKRDFLHGLLAGATASLLDITACFIALTGFFELKISIGPDIRPVLKVIAAAILILLSRKLIRDSRTFKIPSAGDKIPAATPKPVLGVLLLYVTNPTLYMFWIAVAGTVTGHRLVQHGGWTAALFAAACGLGSFAWYVSLVRFMSSRQSRIRAELFRKLLFYMGLALVAFAIYTLGTVFI